MEQFTSETCELNKYLQCEIEIKNEPVELPEVSYSGIQLQPLSFVDVKPIANGIIHDPEMELQPVSFVDVKPIVNEITHDPEMELQPVSFVDVKPIVNQVIHDRKSSNYFGRKRRRNRKMSPATRVRLKRAMETEEQRSERLRKNRERVAQKRAVERQEMLLNCGRMQEKTQEMSPASKICLQRAMETARQCSERLRKNRERMAQKRAAERQEVGLYLERLKKRREKVAQKRSQMSPEQRLEMLKKDREYKRLKRLKEKLLLNMIESVGPNIHSSCSFSNNVFLCNVCNISVSDDRTFNEHYLSHFKTYNYFCEFCGKGFFYQYDLREHKLSHINTSELVRSDICSSQHVSQIDLLNHCRNVHSTQNFEITCNICHEFFYDKKSLKNHMKSHCVEIKDSEIREKTKFLCEICGKMISTSQGFQNHYRIHTGEKPFICKDCGKSFTAYVGLHFHSRTHTGQKPYKCEYCEKTFTQRSSYVVHVRLHTGEKPFPCKICDKSFVSSSLLKVHFQKAHENI